MGVFAVAIAIVGALSIVQPSPPEYDRTRARSNGEVAVSVFTGNAIISVFRSILIAGVAFLGGRFLGDDGVRGVFPVLGLSPLVSIPGDLPLKFFLVNLCVPLERPPLLPD